MASRVRAFYNWLWDTDRLEDYLEHNLADRLKMPPKETDVDEPLSLEQVQKLLLLSPTIEHYAMCLTILRTGLRRGELNSLRTEGITAPTTEGGLGRAFISGKRKSYSVPFTEDVYLALKAIAPPEGYVFYGLNPSRPLAPNTISRKIHEAFEAAGIKMASNGPQMLRHTWVVFNKERASTAVTAALARHDPTVTMKTYGRFGDPFLDQEFQRVQDSIELPGLPQHLGTQRTLPLEELEEVRT